MSSDERRTYVYNLRGYASDPDLSIDREKLPGRTPNPQREELKATATALLVDTGLAPYSHQERPQR
jgi:hypothetical protein